jgi:hypothetical protein
MFVLIVVVLVIPFADGGQLYSDMYGTIAAKLNDLMAQFRVKMFVVKDTLWPLMALLAVLLLAISLFYFTRSSGAQKIRAHKRLARRQKPHRRRGWLDRILTSFFGALGLVRNFLKIVFLLGGIFLVYAGSIALIAIFPQQFQDAWLMASSLSAPSQLQGGSGVATVYLTIAMMFFVFFIIFLATVKSFSWLLPALSGVSSGGGAYIIAYLLYGASLCITIGLFNRAWLLASIGIVFIIAPILVGLIMLLFEEEKRQN